MNHINDKEIYIRHFVKMIILLCLNFYLLYLYDFNATWNTLTVIVLINIIFLPFFLIKDSMNPFFVFLITSQFLFIFNMVDVHINKSTFRYGDLSYTLHDWAFFSAYVVIILWFLSMYFGFVIVEKTKITNKLNPDIKNKEKIARFLLSVSLLSYLIMFVMQGGLSGIIGNLNGRVQAYSGLTYFIKLTELLTLSSLIYLYKGKKRFSFILICLSFVFLASFGGRANAFFGSILPYTLLYHYTYKRVNLIKLIPIAIVFMYFFIGVGNYRLYNEFRLESTNFYELLSDLAHGIQGGEILPALVGNILHGNIEYKLGSTIMNIIYTPIPSSIWKGKPMIDESGIVGKELMGSNSWGLPPGPYGIAFLNFGFIGVIIIGILTGILVNLLYKKLIKGKTSTFIQKAFYVLTITSFLNWVSVSKMITIVWYILVFSFLMLLDRFFTRYTKTV